MEKEKEFVYLVETNEGDQYSSFKNLIGVTRTYEKAEEIAKNFNEKFVEGFIETPMSVDFFDMHICELAEETSGEEVEYRDYLGYTASQWKEMERIVRIIDYGYSQAYITKVELQ